MASSVSIREGTLWSVIWWGVKFAQKFVSNLILTRLLAPEIFGIAAIGNAILTGVTMFSDFGIKQNVVRSNRTDDRYYQTAWTVQLIRGSFLALIVLLLAIPVEKLYEIEGLSTFMIIVAASMLAMGFNNIEVLRDYRHATLRRLAVIDNIAALIGLVTMVIWAWFSPSYVALAVGAVTSTTALTLGTYLAYPRNNCRLVLDKEALAELVVFGKWVLVSTIFGFATMQMDRLALGKLVTLQLLGLYSIAWLWASMPNQILGQWAEGVFYPLVSEQLRNKSGKKIEWLARRLLVLLAGVAAIVMFAISDTLVNVLYPQDYRGVATLLRGLSLVFLLYTIEQSYSHILISQGRPRDKIIGQMLGVAAFVLLLLPVFNWWDIDGVIWLLAASAGVRIGWMFYQFRHVGLAEFKYDFIVAGAFLLGAPVLHAANTISMSYWYQIPVALLEGAGSLAIALLAYRHLRRACDAPNPP